MLGFVGTANDVTDQKRGLSRTDTLLREVSHRSKNMLALILAMARLTARDAVDVKSHLKEFALRVAGLSASQDLIVAAVHCTPEKMAFIVRHTSGIVCTPMTSMPGLSAFAASAMPAIRPPPPMAAR